MAGDAAGFPNGRRLIDDVVTIELRAVAGLTIPLVDPSYTPDGAASAVTDGTTNTNAALLETFPYLGLPGGGYQTKPGNDEGVVSHRSDENPHAGQGAVLLDIGGDVGALVVTMPAAMVGEEVEVLDRHARSPATTARTSPSCRGRSPAALVPSLVFRELVEGSYALVPKGTDDVRLRVDVRGGAGHHGRLAGLTRGQRPEPAGTRRQPPPRDVGAGTKCVVRRSLGLLSGDPRRAPTQQQSYMKSAMPVLSGSPAPRLRAELRPLPARLASRLGGGSGRARSAPCGTRPPTARSGTPRSRSPATAGPGHGWTRPASDLWTAPRRDRRLVGRGRRRGHPPGR